MKFSQIAFVTLLGFSMATPAFAQQGSSTDTGMGPGMSQGTGQGMGQGMGAGTGPGMRGGYGFSQKNTPGWQLLTPEERTAFMQKMRSVKTYDECNSVMADHRKLVAERAKEKNVTLRTPRRNPCDRMKARGLIQ